MLTVGYPLHSLPSRNPSTRVDLCRSLLTAMDIYGRAGRWAEVAEAFSTLAYGDTPSGSFPGATTDSCSAADAAVAGDLLAAIHSAPLAFAVTAYLKLGQVEVAAAALSAMRASLRSEGIAVGAVPGVGTPWTSPGVTTRIASGRGRNGGGDEAESRAVEEETLADGVGGDSTKEFVYMGRHPDVAWVNLTVRAFVRRGRWDLAAAVLSPEICEWACVETVATRKVRQQSTKDGAGDDVRREMEKLRQSLGAFLETKATAKRPAHGTVEGAKACIRALERAAGTVGTHRSVPPSCGISPLVTVKPTVEEVEDGEHVGKDRSLEGPLEAGSDATAGKNGRPKTRTELVRAEALRALASSEVQREAPGIVEEASSTTFSELSDLRNTLPPWLPVDFAEGANNAGEVTDELLRSRASCLSAGVILAAVRRAWASDSCRGEEEMHDIGKCAALALYEAGVDAGKLSAGVQWASSAAGVMDLSGGNFSNNQAAGMCALHVVLKDMLRQYAFKEEVSMETFLFFG